RRGRELDVEAVERRARASPIVQAVPVESPDAQDRRDVFLALVTPDEAGRLALAEHALEVVDRDLIEAELLVEEARVPQRVIEEGAERVGPAVGDPDERRSRGAIVAERLEVFGRREGDELDQLG